MSAASFGKWAALGSAVALTLLIGGGVYFDYKRRNDRKFRKKLSNFDLKYLFLYFNRKRKQNSIGQHQRGSNEFIK